jgi:hypothetical protein
MFMEQLPNIKNPTFLSYELLYLYKEQYLKSLDLTIPVAWDEPSIHSILQHDSNEKYIHYIDEHSLDNCNITGNTLKDRI